MNQRPMRSARLAQTTLAAALTALLLPAVAKTISERAERDEVTYMAREEPAMRAAFAKAAATLDGFLAKANPPAPGTDDHSLKVAFSDGRHTEYMWVVDFSARADRFTGRLNNTPRNLRRYSAGQRVEFSRKQIADWTYTDTASGRMMGNFTGCALLSKEPPEEARAFRERYGLACD